MDTVELTLWGERKLQFAIRTSQLQSRTIALFPGAFRPPHAAHYAAVLDLVARPKVDEVVVIIANRSRLVPGTSLAIDAETARQVWSIYLRELPDVRVEIARHDAISHALGYFERAQAGDHLLFCIGETDFGRGDDRFTMLQAQAESRGVSASIVTAPTGTMKVRATEVRQSLAADEREIDTFMAALPSHLDESERANVWSICIMGLREMREIAAEKLPTILDRQDVSNLTAVGRNSVDPVFRVQLENGRSLFVKYAGDTVEEGCVGKPWAAKPRRRLGAERRAIRYLQTRPNIEVALPEVISFDKETQTLLLSEVCPAGVSLQNQLENAIFDVQVAAAAARFLATCHNAEPAPKHLWGEPTLDERHWLAMLALRTVQLNTVQLNTVQLNSGLIAPPVEAAQLAQILENLQLASQQATRKGFFHLDFCPKNIRIANARTTATPHIGVIDFELSTSVGDPACDFGFFIGHYLFWGGFHSLTSVAWNAIQAAVHSYQEVSGRGRFQIVDRVVAFAGVAMLNCMIAEKKSISPHLRCELLATAKSFLHGGNAGFAD